MTATEKLLCEAIAIPSVNPEFLPPKDPRAGEARLADFLTERAERSGLSVEKQEVLPGRWNLLIRLTPPTPPRQRVILAPHLDTVPDADSRQLHPALRQGRIYGRGACDTKGCVAAMFKAVLDLAGSRQRPQQTEIIFAGLIDEESLQAGSRAMAQSGLTADLAIVGEPTLCRVVTAHKGNLWIKLVAEGKSAHGARPELGTNAIHLMARIVSLIETKYARQLTRRTHPLLGCATINVGTITGGRQPNIVPDAYTMVMDRRYLPGESEAGIRAEILALLEKNGLAASLDKGKSSVCLPLETDPQLPLVRRLMKAVGQRKACGVDYFCDASVLAQGGIPSVVFGPGNIDQAHTADEWISREELARGHQRLLHFLRSLP
jgi:acetylornithine deacetylase/succinyl-diaminopimelate desuccinylase-like protein